MFDRLGARANDANLSEEELRNIAVSELERVIAAENVPLTAAEQKKLIHEISADVLGYGPIQALLDDSSITEVMANNVDGIWVERAGKLELTESRFCRRASQAGHRTDRRSGRTAYRRVTAMVDARLPDGSQCERDHPSARCRWATLTIRKFSHDVYSANDLVAVGTATHETMELLEACVKGKLNILISGGTGTGKTTLLNAVSAFIPDDERIVTVEDAVELRLNQRHVVRLESRTANIEGKGECRYAISCATVCACAPIASSSERCGGARLSTCSRP